MEDGLVLSSPMILRYQPQSVLILVVVEDGLVQHIEFAMLQWDLVLILVVVEDGLVRVISTA